MSLLGIDIGTTGCKAAAFCEDGACLASAYREYPTLHPQEGWAELDSRKVWAAVCEIIREVAARTCDDPITALAASSMGEAMTPVSRDREILGNCILMSDARGSEYVDVLRAQLDQPAFYAINPNILGPHYSLPKLRWLKAHQPQLYARADKFLLWGDIVAFMLGCDPMTSYSLANRTLLFDIRAEDWSPSLLAFSGLNREKLPIPVPSGTVAGVVHDRIAADLGLPRGVRVVVGGHDQCCNAFGAGITQAGRAVCGIGTFECITPVYDHLPDTAAMLTQGMNIEHHVLPGLYVSFLYNQAGSLVRWFRDTFAADALTAADIYEKLSAEMPADPTGLFVLPYFEQTGPPHFVSDASGAILGLKTSTTRGEILKAIMEAVTFYFVESVQALAAMGIDTTELIATGGGAKSDAWLQITADILGVPVLRPRTTEAGTLGAAMLAGIATGAYATPDEAVAHCVTIKRRFVPDASRHHHYCRRAVSFRELYPALQALLKE